MTPVEPNGPHDPRGRWSSLPLLHEETSREIIGGFYEVYNTLGYGFREVLYSRALTIELELRGLHVQREVWVDAHYKGRQLGKYRIDMLVNGCVVVENKSTRWIVQSDRDQLLNGIRCSLLQVGLLLHFGPRPKVYRMSDERRM